MPRLHLVVDIKKKKVKKEDVFFWVVKDVSLQGVEKFDLQSEKYNSEDKCLRKLSLAMSKLGFSYELCEKEQKKSK